MSIFENVVYSLHFEAVHGDFIYRPDGKAPFEILHSKSKHDHVVKVSVASVPDTKVYLHALRYNREFNALDMPTHSGASSFTISMTLFDRLNVHVRTKTRSSSSSTIGAESWATIAVQPPHVMAYVPLAKVSGFSVAAFGGRQRKNQTRLHVQRTEDDDNKVSFKLQCPAGISVRLAQFRVRVQKRGCISPWMKLDQPLEISDQVAEMMQSEGATFVLQSRTTMEVHDSAATPVWLHDSFADQVLRKYARFAPQTSEDAIASSEEDTRDLTLLVGPGQTKIRVHCALLVSQTPVIAVMLNKRWQKEQHTLQLSSDCPDTWLAIVRFLYTGTIDAEFALDALHLAHFYGMRNVMHACEMTLCEHVDLDAADDAEIATLRQVAELYERQELHKLVHSKPEDALKTRELVMQQFHSTGAEWHHHMSRILRDLILSGPQTGDVHFKLAERPFCAHTFVLRLMAPGLDLQLAAKTYNAVEIECLVRHIYVGESLRTLLMAPRMSEVCASLSWRLAKASGLELLAGEWEARSMAMYSQSETREVMKNNRRSVEWFERLGGFDAELMREVPQMRHELKKPKIDSVREIILIKY